MAVLVYSLMSQLLLANFIVARGLKTYLGMRSQSLFGLYLVVVHGLVFHQVLGQCQSSLCILSHHHLLKLIKVLVCLLEAKAKITTCAIKLLAT